MKRFKQSAFGFFVVNLIFFSSMRGGNFLTAKGEEAILGKNKSKLENAFQLPEPTEFTSLEVLSRGARVLLRGEHKLLIAAIGQRFGTETKFNPNGKTREQVFGAFSEFKKPLLMEAKDKDTWVYMRQMEQEKLMALDGKNFGWAVMDHEFKLLYRRTIPWDMIRPPRDRGGEATRLETAEFRRRFFKNWYKSDGLKLAGAALSIPQWKLEGKNEEAYLLGLRISEFPIGVMVCDKEDSSLCRLDRGCFIEGGKIAPHDLMGLGVSRERGLILIGDRSQGKILGYRFHSCFHVTYERSWILPPKLKKLSHLMIDHDDRLWVLTDEPDDYLNASVFYWNRDLW